VSITCKICNQSFQATKLLFHHLNSTHRVDREKYVEENFSDFIDFGWRRCTECNTPFVRGSSLRCGSCYTKNHNTNNNQFIECRLCNKQIHSKVISIHLKSHHDVEFLDYVDKNFSDFDRFNWIRCKVCNKVTKSYAKKGGACSRECAAKIRHTWVGENSSAFGFRHTQETKDKIGLANSHPRPDIVGNNNPACRKEVREKISKTRIDRELSKGKNNPMFGKTHTTEAIKKIMSHRPMNKLEKMVASELDRLNLKYTFQFFITSDGVCKSYDFKIKRKPIIIEVDGDFWHGNPDTKSHHTGVEETKENDTLKERMANDRNYRVLRFWETDVKNDLSVIENKLKEAGLLVGQ